jgi:peptide/nickel transport system permease protein
MSLRNLPTTLFVGAGIFLVWIVVALCGPLLAGTDPNALNFDALLQEPNISHIFGTDYLGRDIFTRVIYAARIDIWMGFAGVLPALVIGTLFGLMAGYFGGVVEAILMRVTDIAMAFPFFVLVLAIVAVLGPGLTNFFIAIAAVNWISYARLIRSEVLVVKNAEYVLAARILGYHPLFIAFRHVLPNVLAPIIVYAMTDAVLVVLYGASLGFLGLGVQPPTAEWGVMISNGYPYFVEAWWICLFPGLATVTLGLGLSLIGDGLAKHLRITN